MAITVSQVETLCTAAQGLIAAGDYAGAIAKLQQAKALMVALPNRAQDGASLAWDRQAIDALIADLRREQIAAAGSIRTSKIQYKQLEGTDDP